MTKKYYNSKGTYRTRIPPENKKTKECQLWENIRIRCEYLPKINENRFGKYSDVSCCEEWLDFQNFAEWFYKIKQSGYYKSDWQLDKDLLLKDNKIYCPEYCVFLPTEINKALNTKSRCRGELPLGLSFRIRKKIVNRNKIYVNFVCKDEQFTYRNVVNPDEIEKGFYLYKTAREKYIKHLAEKYKEDIDPRAYKALIQYEVCIDD